MGIFDDFRQKNSSTSATQPNAPAPKSETFAFARLPESLEELQQCPEASLQSPFQTAALTVCALCAYAAAPQIGIEMLNFLKGPQPLSTYELQFLRDRFAYMNVVPFSFFEGATPENDYTPNEPFSITVKSQATTDLNGERVTLFLHSGGADSDRPITLRRKGNQYFLWEQYLLSGIRQPRSADPWG